MSKKFLGDQAKAYMSNKVSKIKNAKNEMHKTKKGQNMTVFDGYLYLNCMYIDKSFFLS